MIDAAIPLVAAAVESGRIPGAALGSIAADGTRAVWTGGLAQREPEPVPLARGMPFDLASLTKVILTTTELLRLVEAGRVGLDDPLARALPDLHQYDLAHPIRKLTLRRCLAHESGLPAVAPIYTWGNDPRTLEALVLQRDWPLGAYVYSDINFMLLGFTVERLAGASLADFAAARGFQIGPGPANAVATERCTWRRRVIRGEVHDENAFALGGVAGHAGLFGTVDAVLDFARALLAGELIGEAARREMAGPASPTRALGWQRRHPGWSGGQGCSPATLGHTGFTGTGLWVDFERGVAWTLLTNRVHPSRHVETGIAALREAVGEAVAGAAR